MMRVLFICSGNSSGEIGAVTRNQAESLIDTGIEIDIFPISGKGVFGYLSYVRKLRRNVKANPRDIYHAHYLWSGLVASLAGCRPLVVSLMGSDVYSSWLNRVVIRIFNFFSWDKLIVKSESMFNLLNIRSAVVIPNGVNTNIFTPQGKPQRSPEQIAARRVLFIGNPSRKEKNYKLAEAAINSIEEPRVELINVYNRPSAEIAELLNDVDLLLLTSKYEGSPNVIKEAMATNCPIVTTDVGDVRLLLGNIRGCYISESDINHLSRCIRDALHNKFPPESRKRIFELGLDADSVARRILALYKSVINQ